MWPFKKKVIEPVKPYSYWVEQDKLKGVKVRYVTFPHNGATVNEYTEVIQVHEDLGYILTEKDIISETVRSTEKYYSYDSTLVEDEHKCIKYFGYLKFQLI